MTDATNDALTKLEFFERIAYLDALIDKKLANIEATIRHLQRDAQQDRGQDND